MKKQTKKYLVRGLSVAMAGLLCSAFFTTETLQPCAQAAAQATVTGALKDVTGQVSTDDLRKQYYDKDVVQENTLRGEDERWVIVGFDGNSVMEEYVQTESAVEFTEFTQTSVAKARVAELTQVHNDFLRDLKLQGIAYEYKYSYTLLNNGVAVKVRRDDIAKIEKIDGVSAVAFSENYAYPQAAVSNNANVYSTGIYDSENTGYDGTGMVVAVLDSGLDKTHPAFQTMPTGELGLDKDAVEAAIPQLEASKRVSGIEIDQVYYNDKIPFAFDYADNDVDVYPSYSSHGTHVSGIIVGKDDNKRVSKEDETETFVGVAPNAQLVFCDVFTDDPESLMLGGSDTVDILAALTDCVKLGVDVINMSLGSSAGFTSEGDRQEGDYVLQEVYDSIQTAGISLIVAASNDYSAGYGGAYGTNLASNPDSGVVGSPSTYAAALSVASINGKEDRYMVANKTATSANDVAFITNASDVNGNEIDFMEQLYEKTGTAKGEELTLDYVVVGGVGRPGNYTANIQRAFENGNTVALVKRGDITFAEKVENAMAAGAIGCIIYNNVSGKIRMSLGEVEDPIPTCSITMEAGKMLVDGASGRPATGTITFSYDYTAGPFMSDFSSWGPTPDLKLKPEITAHGGDILSSVPGGGYEEQSGTSMATPNMAGAVALLRQHVENTVDFGTLTGAKKAVAVNERVYQLLMSTATIAKNEEGNPYSPRKQGAGLADIKSAMTAEGYVTVSDGKGGVADRSKLELGDDKNRTGKYTLEFTVNNTSGKTETYIPRVYVMTETLASDKKTVAEKAYMLDDSSVEITVVGGTKNGETVTVPANGKVTVKMVVTLSAAAKAYLDASFENGMFIEGFARMEKTGSTTVSLGVPFLAFYGDWTDAPLFDYSVYEVAEEEKDQSIEEEDKIKASAAETRPLGLYYDDMYILPLGTYIYEMDEFETDIYPDTDKAAVSVYDEEGRRTIYEMYAVYAGLLRGAKTMDITITDAQTGDVVYSKTQNNVRKSFAAGGGNYASPILFEIDPLFWNMSNNTTYNVSMQGKLDYAGGENPERNSFEFSFTIDSQAPVITDYRIRFEPYTENKEVKYRIYMDVDVYDNQYTMDLMPCYSAYNTAKQQNELQLLTEYPLPVYSKKNEKTTVSFEVTNYYDKIKNGEVYLAVEDYAMNQSVYQLAAVSGLDYPDKVSFATDDKLTFKGEENGINVYQLTLQPNETYKITATSLPEGTIAQSLSWYSSRAAIVNGFENQIHAYKSGTARLEMRNGYVDADGYINGDWLGVVAIEVTVEGEALIKPQAEKITLEYVYNGKGFLVDPNSVMVEMNPNQTEKFTPKIEPWYCDVDYEWSTSNDKIVSVDQIGNVTTHRKGTASITVRAKGYDRLTKTVRIKVGEDFYVNSFTLYDYYGGPEVVIPDDLNVMYLSEDTFKNNTKITKVVLPKTLMEIPEEAFYGCTSLKEIVIPAECTQSGKKAFANCISLEKVTLLPAKDEITGGEATGSFTAGIQAFSGCTKLTTIVNPHRLTTAYDNAFENCVNLTSVDLSGLRIAGKYVFANCTKLANVTTTADTFIGEYMFYQCTALQSFTYKASRLSAGAFMGCKNMTSFTFETDVLYGFGANAFSGCGQLQEMTLPSGVYGLGANAFLNCVQLKKVTLSQGTRLQNTAQSPFTGCTALTEFAVATGNGYYTAKDGVLYNIDITRVELVPTALENVVLPDTVKEIGDNAFAGSAVQTVDTSNVEKIGKYAFAGSKVTAVDLSNVTEIAEGAFANCISLTTVENVENVVSVGDYAFNNASKAWQNQTVAFADGLTYIGTYAFHQTAMSGIVANGVVSVGDYAFYNSKLQGELSLPAVKNIGAYAFAENSGITKISLGAVEKMGRDAFSCTSGDGSQPALTEVRFAEGATTVGERNAFVLYDSSNKIIARTALTKVSLPTTVKEIGAQNFEMLVNLGEVDLSQVESIGARAFYGCENLTLKNDDAAKVKKIENYAFALTEKVDELELASVTQIGEGAFMESGLKTVALPLVERIGEGAFTRSKLSTLTLPNTDTLTYDDSWWELTPGGEWDEVTGKKTAKIREGAFADIATLTTINVSGNGKMRSIDGVLYMETNDGLVLTQYPANKAGATYTVAKNTVRIADFAFVNTLHLESVSLPYSVRSIGSFAFFNQNESGKYVKTFTFEGVEAPTLEASYTTSGGIYVNGDTDAYAYGLFYANFKGYVKDAVNPSNLDMTDMEDFGLTVSYPENGIGYDSPIWKAYFHTASTTAYAADKTTRAAMEAIAALPTVEEINAITTKDGINSLSKDVVQKARIAFNAVTAAAQRDLITDSDKLLEVEAAVRAAKQRLGVAAAIQELVIEQQPDKLRYVDGETFDKTGMIVKVIYDDLSQLVVEDYTVDKTVLTAGEEAVVPVTITYEGKTCTLNVSVTYKEDSGDDSTSSDDSSSSAEDSTDEESSDDTTSSGESSQDSASSNSTSSSVSTESAPADGCGGSIAFGAAGGLLTLSAAALLIKRRKEDDNK